MDDGSERPRKRARLEAEGVDSELDTVFSGNMVLGLLYNASGGAPVADTDDGGGLWRTATGGSGGGGQGSGRPSRRAEQEDDDPMDLLDRVEAEESGEALLGHDGDRIQRLEVASATGAGLGTYVPRRFIGLDKAYREVQQEAGGPSVLSYTAEIRAQIANHLQASSSGGGPLSRGRTSGVAEADIASEAVSRLLGASPRPASANPLGQRPTDGLVESLTQRGHEADLEYITEKFRRTLSEWQIDEATFFRSFCPLCGFADNSQDAIRDRDYKYIRRVAEEGVGNIDPNTHALILSTLWNQSIYLPMKQARRRILPLSFEMALSHIKTPHRPTMNGAKLKCIERMDKIIGILYHRAFGVNGLTGEPVIDLKMLDVARRYETDRMRIWGSDVRKDTFSRHPGRTAANAGDSVNPLQHTKRK